jgi:arylsulfatase A-like enzyme
VPAGKVARRLVSTIDVAPTVYRLAGLRPPAGLEGHDLLRPLPPGAETYVFSQYRDVLLSVRTPRFKLIRRLDTGRHELYDLLNDPGELQDVATERAGQVARLGAKLDAWKAARPSLAGLEGSDLELDAERLEQLQALGYVE